jgi:hypothetical protein
VAVPTPAALGPADTARQLAELNPIQGDGRVSTLHYLLARCFHILTELEELTTEKATPGRARVSA